MQISKGFNGLSLTYYLIRPCSLILRSFSSPTFCSFTFFCLNIIFRTNPTDNLISQIPASMQYGSTAKYLTSELPELLRKLKETKPREVINPSEEMKVWSKEDKTPKRDQGKARESNVETKHDYNLRSKAQEKRRE